jgi:putative glycosyltransferase
MRISLVTPLYRSGDQAQELYRRAVATITKITPDYEIIFVNDGSPDDSLRQASDIARSDSRVTVIDLSRNFGQHPALMTGLRYSTGDFVFVCDSDLEEDPEWIEAFYRRISETGCDVVYGVQTARKGTRLYRTLRAIFYTTLNLFSGIRFPSNTTTARLMTRRFVDALLQFRERELFAAGIWHMTGFTQLGLPVAKPDRSATTYGFAKLVSIFINAVTAFSTRPLQLISMAGVTISMLALVLIVYLAAQKLLLGVALLGWTSVMATVLLTGGVIVFFNGIMAIYLAKIFIEVKQRPLTTIRDVINPPQPATRPQLAAATNASYLGIVQHYEACLERHQSGARAVDWKNEETAQIRYDAMLELVSHETRPLTLLDFGCGLGDLKKHMDLRGLDHIHYEGLDISPAYAEAARKNLPGVTIHCLDLLEASQSLPQFDYVVMNGVFTRRESMPTDAMLAYLQQLTSKAFAHTRHGLAFNVMSMNVDWKDDALFYPRFDEVANMVSRNLSRHMVLRDNYGLHECSCYVYREPVRAAPPSGSRKAGS